MGENQMSIVIHLKVIVVISVYNLLNVAFLSLWVMAQWLLKRYVVDQHRLVGLDLWTLQILQFVFLLATIAPVVAWIYFDTISMIRFLAQVAREDREGGSKNGVAAEKFSRLQE